MPESKPTILLNHGAYHTPSAWSRLIPLLEEKGYSCIAPQLCFCGTDEPIASWKTCTGQIQNLLSEETSSGRDVVVVNHSLGGLPGCSAVEGFTKKSPERGRVLGIVQLTAMNFATGAGVVAFYENLYSLGRPRPTGDWKVPPATARETFYNDLEDSDAEYWVSKLLPNSALLDSSQEGIYPGFKDVPVWYIKCMKDMALRSDEQDFFIETIEWLNPNVKIREMDTDHSPFLSKPEETAALIDEAVVDFPKSSPEDLKETSEDRLKYSIIN